MNESFTNGEKYNILMEDLEKANNAMKELAESVGSSIQELVKSLKKINDKYGPSIEESPKIIFNKILAFKEKFDPEYPGVGYSIFYNESLFLYDYMKTSSPALVKFTSTDLAIKCCNWLNGLLDIEDLEYDDSDKDRLKLAENIIGGVYHSMVNNTKIEVGTKDGHRAYGTTLLFDEDEFNKIKQFLQIKEEG